MLRYVLVFDGSLCRTIYWLVVSYLAICGRQWDITRFCAFFNEEIVYSNCILVGERHCPLAVFLLDAGLGVCVVALPQVGKVGIYFLRVVSQSIYDFRRIVGD